jgi:hypothetical protein
MQRYKTIKRNTHALAALPFTSRGFRLVAFYEWKLRNSAVCRAG